VPGGRGALPRGGGGGGGVALTGLGTSAADVIDALVEQLGRDEQAIGLAIIGDKLEDSCSSHVVVYCPWEDPA